MYACAKCQDLADPPRNGEEPLCDYCKLEKKHPSGARRIWNLIWAINHVQEIDKRESLVEIWRRRRVERESCADLEKKKA